MSYIAGNIITVFEHQKLLFDVKKPVEKMLLDALVNYYGSYSPFFSLIRNGVQFNEHVGVIQIGNTTIEILPKADNNDSENWRQILIEMLRVTWSLDVRATGTGMLKLKPNSVLDLYFELFIAETEKLLHKGLIRKYEKREGNLPVIRGALQFPKHISKNIAHKERFYVKYTNYSVDHTIHQILYKTIKLLKSINNNISLKNRIGALMHNFPEVKDICVTQSTFSKISYNRKNIEYKTALEIAKLLLLNYHPDLSAGRNNVLALMFNMNNLWEQFILSTLKQHLRTHEIKSQFSKNFWKSESSPPSTMRPDIVITNKTSKQITVLDTKWKTLNGYNPSPQDLRQMYVYHRYFAAGKVALIYPGKQNSILKGSYYSSQNIGQMSNKECSIVEVRAHKNIRKWQQNIVESIRQLVYVE